jgi:putative hydrolase of the HAD superfamily
MKIVSFDLDGTLVTDEFSQMVWHQGIPELYVEHYGCDYDEAKHFIVQEYNKVGDKALEWYNIHHWLTQFKLDGNWENLFQRFTHLIKAYPEVPEVLSSLRRASYQLIITSNAAREFLETEIEKAQLTPFFDYAFSATSDFREVKKTADFYQRICTLLHIHHTQIIHVGDHFEFDYLIPRSLGIRSFFLDRKGTGEGSAIVKDLREFINKLYYHNGI